MNCDLALLPPPTVSVFVMVYNHEKYIAECLDGILMQKCNFSYNIVVGEDASTDKSREILLEYCIKYPGKFKLILHEKNIGAASNQIAVFRACTGKYIALCEGDDYWTDPYKLQKQVDFLEENPGYSLCVGGFKKHNVITKNEEDIIIIPKGVVTNDKGYAFTLNDTKKGWLTKTLTSVFRNDKDIFNLMTHYRYGRDVNLFYHILKTGKGFYFTEIMGVYRVHEGGVNSMKQGRVNSNAAYNRLYND